MTYVLSGSLVLVVAVLGWVVLPMLGLIVTIPIQMVISIINRFLGYMVSRYATLAFDFAVMIWLITWAGEKWGLVTWPAWMVAGWCMFTAGNTLILFDIQCYVTDSGAWAPKDDLNYGRFADVRRAAYEVAEHRRATEDFDAHS